MLVPSLLSLSLLHPFVLYLFLSTPRRLLTQLEAARSNRGSTGEGKASAAAKAPDGVVLYELHSRPEQEKFTDAAKVRGPGAMAWCLPNGQQLLCMRM